MRLSQVWSKATPIFDEVQLVSFAGLVPVMGLAEGAGLSELISAKVAFKETRVRSAAVNPAGKLTSIIAGMAAGADCIDDLDVIRSGGMPRLFAEVYACSTLGQLLREFTHGHALQLASVLRAHLVNLVAHSGLQPGISERVFVDIDSLLRPVYGHQKQGADLTLVCLIATLAEISSDKPACSANAITGTRPANDTRCSSSNFGAAFDQTCDSLTESAFRCSVNMGVDNPDPPCPEGTFSANAPND